VNAREPITGVEAASADYRAGLLVGVVSEVAALADHLARLPHDQVADALQRSAEQLGQLDGEVRAAGGRPLVDDATRSIWAAHWAQVAAHDDVRDGGA
jgi:hypothetical protein